MVTSNIHVLHPTVAPLASFLRIGYTGHHKLAALHAANRFAYQRVVFDACYVRQQTGLLQLLKSAGCEIVLDLNFAETATPGRFDSAVSKLPWGNAEQPWQPSDFGPGRNANLIKLMAEFAVQVGANAVLAPTHAVDTGQNGWQAIDLMSCTQLRTELDHAGGAHIAIDFQFITTPRVLKDVHQLAPAIEGIADLPIQNIWLRVSGFGATATGVGTRHLIEVTRTLHALGRPIVIDMAGGFAGLSTLAFGAVGGISHGVAQKESFNLAEWMRPSVQGSGGGLGQRVYVSDLDRHLTEKQSQVFFAARGTKARFGCTDTACCRDGIDDMLENGHAHFITQRSRQIEEIARLPEGRRVEYFLLRQLDSAVRSSRQAAKLKFANEGIQRLVIEVKSRLIRLRDALGALNEADAGAASRSRAPTFRGKSDAIGAPSVVLGRHL